VARYENSYNYQTRPQLKSHPVKHITCELCGRSHMYKALDKPPKTCSQCGHPYAETVPVNTYAPDDAKPTTLHQYRVFCNTCKHRAIEWVPKKQGGSIPCRNCGETGYKVRSAKIKPEGDCKTGEVWESDGGFRRPTGLNTKPKKKRFHCPNCGRPHFYLIKPPTKCINCREEMPNDKSKNSLPT